MNLNLGIAQENLCTSKENTLNDFPKCQTTNLKDGTVHIRQIHFNKIMPNGIKVNSYLNQKRWPDSETTSNQALKHS